MKFYLCIVLVLCFTSLYKADIPVHCLKTQIEGDWDFKATKPVIKSIDGLYKMTCGNPNPSHESSAYKFNMDLSLFSDSFSVNLGSNFAATLNENGQSRV